MWHQTGNHVNVHTTGEFSCASTAVMKKVFSAHYDINNSTFLFYCLLS